MLLQLLSRLPDRVSVQSGEKAAASFCSERVDAGVFHIVSKFALAVVQKHQITICIIIQYIVVVQKGLTGLLILLHPFLDGLGKMYWLSYGASTTFTEQELVV